MIWNRQKDRAGDFVNFNHYEQRLTTLEETQHKVLEELRSYVRAEMQATWMPAAKRLCDVLDEALKATEV
jgi:hypothetical protein